MKYIKNAEELVHGKVYYTTYGGKYIIQFDQIAGNQMLILQGCNDAGTILNSIIFSCSPSSWFNNGKEWREATDEEIRRLNREEVLYEIY